MARIKQRHLYTIVELLESEVTQLKSDKQKKEDSFDRWSTVSEDNKKAMVKPRTDDLQKRIDYLEEIMEVFREVIDETYYDITRSNYNEPETTYNEVGE